MISQVTTLKKIFVGMSGGVDSSVSAALLKQAGHDVTGVFIKGWRPEFVDCPWEQDREDAMRVAAQLNIPFKTLDLSVEYKREVADVMIAEYEAGRTPNPDVLCNKHIKFGSFLDFARAYGADFVATGHYAEREETPGGVKLMRSKDDNKDQTYFLWMLTQEQLCHALFPMGGYTKPEVRDLAQQLGLSTAEKKDSQGVCFVGKFSMRDFLKEFVSHEKGTVLDEKGVVIGEHDGARLYTLGQRHGFLVFNTSPDSPKRFVVEKDIAANTITVSETYSEKKEKKGTGIVALRDCNWIVAPPKIGGVYQARIRHRGALIPCTLTACADTTTALLLETQEQVAPGQSVVLYAGAECLGGGIIE